MSDGREFYKRPWRDPERRQALLGGEACEISADYTPPEVVTIAEMKAALLTTEEGAPFRGYCCLVLKRHAVELHDLGDEEAASLMDDMRRILRALQEVTGAVKINVDIHGNTMPHLHAHFFPRYVGDPYEDGPIDFRRAQQDTREFTHGPEELRRFVEDLRSAVGAALRALRFQPGDRGGVDPVRVACSGMPRKSGERPAATREGRRRRSTPMWPPRRRRGHGAGAASGRVLQRWDVAYASAIVVSRIPEPPTPVAR